MLSQTAGLFLSLVGVRHDICTSWWPAAVWNGQKLGDKPFPVETPSPLADPQ